MNLSVEAAAVVVTNSRFDVRTRGVGEKDELLEVAERHSLPEFRRPLSSRNPSLALLPGEMVKATTKPDRGNWAEVEHSYQPVDSPALAPRELAPPSLNGFGNAGLHRTKRGISTRRNKDVTELSENLTPAGGELGRFHLYEVCLMSSGIRSAIEPTSSNRSIVSIASCARESPS